MLLARVISCLLWDSFTSFQFAIAHHYSLSPNRSLGLAWILFFRRVDFVWFLISNSELLRIKNKRKTPWKNKRLQAVVKHYIERTNEWFGLHDNVVSTSRIQTIKVLPEMGKPDNGHLFSIKPWKCKENLCISGCSLIFLFKYLGHSDSRFYLCKKRNAMRTIILPTTIPRKSSICSRSPTWIFPTAI